MKKSYISRNFLLSVMIVCVPFFNSAWGSPESEWTEWFSKMNTELKNSDESFLNVTDTVSMSEGDKVFLALEQAPGEVKWSKTPVANGVSLSLQKTLQLTLEDKKIIDLTKEKKWKLSDGRIIRAGRIINGKQKVYIHDLKSPAQVNFKGLAFYPFDAKAVVTATLERSATPKEVVLKTSGTDTRTFNEVGVVKFNYKGHQGLLKAYSPEDLAHLKTILLFFRDATSAKTTYGAGRNLEIELKDTQQKEFTIDLNRAYSPYCARSKHFQCVLSSEPPLSFAIEAGEQKP